MIKKLITDIAFNRIELSQALTTAKIIASKISSQELALWIKKELEGYSFEDIDLPSYRKIPSTITLTATLPVGAEHSFYLLPPDDNNTPEQIKDIIQYHRIVEPIKIVENRIQEFQSSNAALLLPPAFVNAFSNQFPDITKLGGVVTSGKRTISKSHFENVVEQTKQKLLDILLKLNEEFPKLDDSYSTTPAEAEKIQNIVTNNIYGSNNPINMATGTAINMEINSYNLTGEDEGQLRTLGVDDEKIEELKVLIKQNNTTKGSTAIKIGRWLSSVSASLASKAIFENFPKVEAIISKLIDQA